MTEAEAEMLKRIEQKLDELLAQPAPIDPNRAYSDEEVCRLLGGISRSSLWRIRRKSGHLPPVELYDDGQGGKLQRTTGRAIIDYVSARERAADVLQFTATGRKRSVA